MSFSNAHSFAAKQSSNSYFVDEQRGEVFFSPSSHARNVAAAALAAAAAAKFGMDAKSLQLRIQYLSHFFKEAQIPVTYRPTGHSKGRPVLTPSHSEKLLATPDAFMP